VPRSRQPSAADRELYRQVGVRVRELREKQGVAQEKLAWSAEISKGYLSEIEAGRKSPSVAVLRALAAEMDVPLWALFIGQEGKLRQEAISTVLKATDEQLRVALLLLSD